jgi:cysteine-rich repeat protein
VRALWLVLCVSCVDSSTIPCGELLCPGDTVCVLAANTCVEADLAAACEGANNGDGCDFNGFVGICDLGICETSFCGDGIIDDNEICDDGNPIPGDSCESTCQVATCLVPITHATIGDLVDDLACPIGYINPGTYTERLSITRDVELIGVSVATPVVIDGQAGGTVVTIAQGVDVGLERLEITNGSAVFGGGIDNSGLLALVDVNVTGNSAERRGGGIYHQDGALLILGGSVSDNSVGAMFDVQGGETIVPIDAKLRVREGVLFAVTIEEPGGVVVSDRERLVLLAQP